MKKRNIRIMETGFLLGISILLTACGGKKAETDVTASSKDYVYQAQIASFGEENQNLTGLFRSGDKIYAYGTDYSEEANTALNIVELSEAGEVKSSTTFSIDDDASVNSICADDAGNYYAIRNVYKIPESDTEEPLDLYELISFDSSGTERWAVSLNDEKALRGDAESYFYVGNLILNGDKLLFSHPSGIAVYSINGELQKNLSYSEIDKERSIDSVGLECLSDGRVLLSSYLESGLFFYTYDIEKGTFSTAYTFPGQSYNYSYVPGRGYDLLMSDNTGVYGYNLGDEVPTALMNFVDSDINTYSVYNLLAINETSFIGFLDDEETGRSIPNIFTKVAPEDVPDKETISLAYNMTDWDVRTAVVNFNKTNTKYRIKITDYSALYDTDQDYSAGLNQLNADIVSGKMPDILVIDSAMPTESYVGKGLFEDLKPYIEQDEELDLNNFMPNIIELCSTNDKLYFLVPSFSVATIVGKTEDVGAETGWTLQDAEALLETKPEGTQLFYAMNSDTILMNAMSMAGNQFIDWETGTCSFNSDAFVDLLNFAATFPTASENGDYASEEDYYTEDYDSMWRDGKVLLNYTYLNCFADYNNTKKGTFNSDITCVGFPTTVGNGSEITFGMQLAMSSKSKQKEGAWEFMRYFLTDEYQDKISFRFPTSIKRLDVLGEEAKEDPYYLDENQEKVSYKNTMYINGIEVPIDPMTDEEVQEFKDYLYLLDNADGYKQSVMNIVQEEAAPFFEGQKTAKEVADIIQSRMQVYVDENR